MREIERKAARVHRRERLPGVLVVEGEPFELAKKRTGSGAHAGRGPELQQRNILAFRDGALYVNAGRGATTDTAALVNTLGRTTAGPSGAGSLKNMSTMTRA